jgi:hypothetical protein
MSVNRFQPHVHVLPEDDANGDMANGFLLELASPGSGRLQVLPASGGWRNVLQDFASNHVAGMDRYTERHMVLLIDFDDSAERLNYAMDRVPERLRDRVFILRVLSEPEKLPSSLGSPETIGKAMAKDCRDGTDEIWGQPLLRNNAGEISRLRQHVRPILFQ